ncbi:hypothetical protein HQ305_20125 [Rhodococcus sp. BP-149]|uniref:septum site-determining protein Ssd n=1 Tax=unclassified Rhodococcus (in: high G+C Gram-positive bacteria) TaxID=192944 RepID=UPI001C9B317A|nr:MULTISPECIES: septum site-determining protein Ssd [unclassified Rhodococcus (in: high G+C Gram-positive bacteria)]MBY6687543.1 hypothetical protein [Rhodococcus sp. BP-288]MBY6695708.1 hypothetical protein [Rhodococcus sp. BP-188]MBY6700494.1 hypothetical protein [Rhodococcus sp. BP-285]MBY6704483.1 hypothetical protein [Rhodococcus sp. BP-283]MBY6709037.1 hypothetical protein [Rhodococcus sp. BP-241]
MTDLDSALLVIVPDAALSDRVRRIAAAAGRESSHLGALPDRALWQSSDIVVLGTAAAERAVREHLPRHPGVVVVTDGPADVEAWQSASRLGTSRVLALPAQEADLMGVLSAAARVPVGGGVVVTVVGGCGGAGASVFAAASAVVASRSGRTVLMDGDAAGGGMDLVTGLDGTPGLRWPELVIDGGTVTADALHHALPGRGDLAVLSTRREQTNTITAAAWRAVVDAGVTAGEVVVCDVPRAGPIHEMSVQAADLVVVLVPATVRSAAAAQCLARSITSTSANVGVVVRGPAPSGLTAAEVADVVGLPLLASVRPERRLAAMLDGRGLVLGRRSPLARAAGDVLALLTSAPTT